MEIWFDEDWLKAFYQALVEIYRNTDFPITEGYNEGIISACVERPLTDIYSIIPFPHLLHRAAVLMDTVITFHPFADGNKRVGLLATFYLLYWNGYDMKIPIDADEFTIEVAEGHKNLNDILSWLIANSRKDAASILRNLLCGFLTMLGDNRVSEEIANLFVPLLLPLYPLEWFASKIQRSRKKTEKYVHGP